jgi:hypothetical protein
MASFIVPRTIYHGLGTLEKLKEICGKKAMIVIGGRSMKTSGFLDKTILYLRSAGMETAIFEGVEPDPSLETVMKGAAAFKKEQPDVIIGLGGCSAIDAAKAMWIFYEHPETKLEDIIPPFQVKPLRTKAIFVAIPSTSGTGTEVTCVTVITDRQKGVKYPIVSYEITPDIAIVDGELCQSMPPDVTANTGLDALAHSVEAYVAGLADCYTDALGKSSIQLIFENLYNVYKNPNDMKGRQALHDASCLAGMAFTNGLLGIIHSMAHQLGGMFGIPHGRANAILMPNIIRFNSKTTGKYVDLAGLFGKTSAEEFAQEVEKLRKSVGIEDSLEEYGINETEMKEKLDVLSLNAMNDPCTGLNPRKPTIDEIKKLFEYCFTDKCVDF